MMSKGKKRSVTSDSNPETNEHFGSKRIMEASPFDFNRAVPSRVAEHPPLDAQRAESSRQHVRALNTQFASWIQSQLQNHPDELWEDGVQDYLTHASHIMGKFSDVVDWLKANASKSKSTPAIGPSSTGNKPIFGLKADAAKSESMPAFGSSSTKNNMMNKSVIGFKADTAKLESMPSFGPSMENKSIFGTKNNEIKFQLPEKTGFAHVGSTSSFTSSWSKSPTPVLFGSQNPGPVNLETSDDPDHEDELEQPSSPSVKKSEEKGIVVVHEVKCKLYVKSTDPSDKDSWKDKGMGQLSIKCKEGVSKATKESKPTVVVRNDVGKVLLNALIYPGIKTNLMKNAIVAIFHTSGDGSGNDVVASTYLIRTKTEEERNKLASAIQEYAPAA